jgi:hypothetical protein
MVSPARGADGARALRPLNQPASIEVEADSDGVPVRVNQSGGWLTVGTVQDRWRIYQAWWRGIPVVRDYFAVVLNDGRKATLFQNGLTSQWFRQNYG